MNMPITELMACELGITIPAMTDEHIAIVRDFESMMASLPQIKLKTEHFFHAGMYARAILIPAGVVITGALIKRATMLIVSGHCKVYLGGQSQELIGTHVIPAAAGRKQAFIAETETCLVMLFPTTATTVEAAELEFTDESDKLQSRTDQNLNNIHVTGE